MGKIQCLQCGAILESKHIHDFQICQCANRTFVDGGNEYLRYGGSNLAKIKILKTKQSRVKITQN
jgi:hypothetical protein